VNDTYGHAVGDVVLREVAERVRGHLRAAMSSRAMAGRSSWW
jgi:GGDEF domain-containing protein